MIWRYPGVPSLLVTYQVANDFFFSGHTAIAVFGGLQLATFKRPWWFMSGLFIATFEMATVIVLRAHYSIDVFTGAIAALWATSVSAQLAPRLDYWIAKRVQTRS
jgi:membrane-associated phospholipid phosphatase